MEFTYDDYVLGLRTAGEAIRMDLAYNWERRYFNRDLNTQIINDMNLDSDHLLSIMIMANSYLDSNLFVGLLKHPNFDASSVGYWLNTDKLNGDLHRKQFYLATIREHEDLVTPQFINRALEQYNSDIWIAMLKSKVVCGLISLHDKIELLKANRGHDYFVEEVSGIDHLVDVYGKVYEQYEIDTYLSDAAKDMFLF